jgi:hypothetical protein
MSELPNYQFWVGSYCSTQAGYPDGVNFVSDVITIVRDIGNHIPDKSWMLYLLELFTDKTRNIPLELDLICQFDNQDYFEAIFGSYNQYKFTKVLPEVGHSYIREIIANPKDRLITYNLTDMSTGHNEVFVLGENNMNGNVDQKKKESLIKKIRKIKFEGASHFTGLEWHNRKDNSPFPIKYQVEISLLQYGKLDSIDSDHKLTLPYSSLIPNKGGLEKNYPVLFRDIGLKKNCICYTIDSGNSQDGMTYSLP